MDHHDWTFHPPDWKDAKNYPDPKKMTDPQWGWEFLRRNPDFWADGKEVRDLLVPDVVSINSAQQDVRGQNFFWANPSGLAVRFLLSPEADLTLLKRKLESFRNRWTEPIPLLSHLSPDTPFFMLDGELGEIPFLLNPGDEFRPSSLPPVPSTPEQDLKLKREVPGLKGKSRFPSVHLTQGRTKELPFAYSVIFPAQVAMVFDIRQAWDSQERKAREVFIAIQKHLKAIKALEKKQNDKSDLFPRYLQILDARANGASIREIVSAVFPERISKSSPNGFFDRNLKAAEYWRNDGFLLLLNH